MGTTISYCNAVLRYLGFAYSRQTSLLGWLYSVIWAMLTVVEHHCWVQMLAVFMWVLSTQTSTWYYLLRLVMAVFTRPTADVTSAQWYPSKADKSFIYVPDENGARLRLWKTGIILEENGHKLEQSRPEWYSETCDERPPHRTTENGLMRQVVFHHKYKRIEM